MALGPVLTDTGSLYSPSLSIAPQAAETGAGPSPPQQLKATDRVWATRCPQTFRVRQLRDSSDPKRTRKTLAHNGDTHALTSSHASHDRQRRFAPISRRVGAVWPACSCARVSVWLCCGPLRLCGSRPPRAERGPRPGGRVPGRGGLSGAVERVVCPRGCACASSVRLFVVQVFNPGRY